MRMQSIVKLERIKMEKASLISCVLLLLLSAFVAKTETESGCHKIVTALRSYQEALNTISVSRDRSSSFVLWQNKVEFLVNKLSRACVNFKQVSIEEWMVEEEKRLLALLTLTSDQLSAKKGQNVRVSVEAIEYGLLDLLLYYTRAEQNCEQPPPSLSASTTTSRPSTTTTTYMAMWTESSSHGKKLKKVQVRPTPILFHF